MGTLVLWVRGYLCTEKTDPELGLKEKAVGWGPVSAAEENWIHTSGPAESRQSDTASTSTKSSRHASDMVT